MKLLLKQKMTAIFLLLIILGTTKVHAQTLVLWHSDSTTTDVELYTKPNILFKKDKVLVTSTVANLEYDAKNVLRFTYKGKNTGILSPQVDTDYSQEKGLLVFHNISSIDKVALYNINGIRIPVHVTIYDNSVFFPLSSVPSGIYLLSVNGRTIKFTKK